MQKTLQIQSDLDLYILIRFTNKLFSKLVV